MTRPELALAECLDAWQQGQDAERVIERHPELAPELRSLLFVARRVQTASQAAYSRPLPALAATPPMPKTAERGGRLRHLLQRGLGFLLDTPPPTWQPVGYRQRYRPY
jgi:hypothetical protein